MLVRRETNPDDLSGMIAAEGVLTSRGGKTSHAAVVARGMGKTCVCGAEELKVDTKQKQFTAPGRHASSSEGDVISIDGSTGRVWLGEVPVEAPAVVRYFEGEIAPDSDDADDLVRSVHRILDPRRREAAAGRPHQRRHPGGLRPGPPVRRPGHRPVPHRAHVPRRPAAAGRDADPRRGRGRAERRARPARAAAEAGLPRDLRGDGRPADDDPAARPAAARVPARPHRPRRCGWPSPRSAGSTTRARCGCSPRCRRCTSRTRCSGCAASGSASSSRACSPCRCGRSPRRRPSARRPAATRGRRS